MRKEGTVIRWQAERGFGFIRPDAGGQDVFLHVQQFRSSEARLPSEGLRVSFEEVHVGGKGPRAMAVWPAHVTAVPPRQVARGPRRTSRTRTAPSSGAWFALPLMATYGATLLWAVAARRLPWWVLAASFLLNLAAFYVYWQDKYAAEQRRWRVREKTLQLWSLAGGWIGAWFAQQVLRHKTRKPGFRADYWVMVVAHCAAVGYGLWLGMRLR